MAAPVFTYVVILDEEGNPIKSGNGLDISGSAGGVSQVDDVAFTPAVSSFTPTGGIVTADSVDSGDGGAFAMLANRQQKVTVYDSAGVEATFGSGTQYTEGATDATITGTAVIWEDAADTLVVVSAAKPLPVGDAGGSLTVDNAGLTELAGAINASAQMDVNVAANGIGLLTTTAHDAAFGTAGTADAQVRSIQGIASMTPVQVSQATASNLNMTEASAAAIATSVALIDDTIFVDDTATHATGTTKVIGIGAVADPTDAAVNANDIGMPAMTTTRFLKVIGQSNTGVTIGAVEIAAAQTLATVTTVGTVTTVTTLTGGGIAHDSGDSGNPHKIGGKAIDIATQPTAVTANDRTDWYFNRNGVPFFLGGSPATLTKELDVTDADGAQTDTALVTVSAGTAIIVTAFQAMADHANTVDVGFRCGFGTANTPAADAAGIIASHPGVAAGSGVVVGTGAGIIGMGASNEDLRVTCEDPVTGAIRFIVTYSTVLIG